MKMSMEIKGLSLLLIGIFVASCSREEVAIPSSEPTLDVVEVQEPIQNILHDKTVAVLPFTDLSENHDQEYFSDGLSQDLIERLSMMPDLQVVGRESSFYYKGRDALLNEIGTSLQVANILLGSVRKSGDQIRVTAQLVNAKDGFNIWSRTYDRELSDIFAIQNEIVDEVSTALSVTLGIGKFANPGMTHNIEAYDITLQARALYNQFTPDNVFRAINLLEEALQLDPDYGHGWLFLGDIYKRSQLILSAEQSVGFSAMADNAFARAAEIAPDMPALMLVEAGKFRNEGRFQEAENLYKEYFERYGYSVAQAMEEYARLLSRTGQMNEAVVILRRARGQDPLAPSFTYQVALHELYRGQVEQARELAEYGLTLEGGEWFFSAIDWDIAMRDGDIDTAAHLINEYYADHQQDRYDVTVSSSFMKKIADIMTINDFEKSTEDIISLINAPSRTPLELAYVSRLVALMGQPQIALDYWFGELASPAIWDKVYEDMRRLPDFNQLVQEKGLVDYWRATGNWGDFCIAAGGRDFVCR